MRTEIVTPPLRDLLEDDRIIQEFEQEKDWYNFARVFGPRSRINDRTAARLVLLTNCLIDQQSLVGSHLSYDTHATYVKFVSNITGLDPDTVGRITEHLSALQSQRIMHPHLG